MESSLWTLLLRAEVFQDLCPGRTLRLSISGGFFSSVELGLLWLLRHLPAACRTRPAPSNSRLEPVSSLADLRAVPSLSSPCHCPHLALFIPALCSRLSAASCPLAGCLRGMPSASGGAGRAPSRVAHSVLTQGQRVDGGEPCGTREELLLSRS